MPVRGAQKNVLELFIRDQSDFAVDPEPDERSGRVLISDDLREKLLQRKRSVPDAKNGAAASTAPAPKPAPKAAPKAAEGLGNFLTFSDTPAKPAAAEAATPEHHLPLPPWARTRYLGYREAHASLHEEIVDWMRYMEPRPAERALRNRLINRLVDVLQRGPDALFPECEVHVFGSMKTGLLVPASDVDICVAGITSCSPQAALERISVRLEVVGLCLEKPRYIQAKVPIVKFTDKVSKLECDCSVNAIGGRQNTEMVRRLLDQYPQSRPIILIIKTFLRQRKLNEVFTGGLSTYSISLMVIHMLQMFHSHTDQAYTSLGKLLIDFFHLYGFLLDYDHVALSVRGGGCYIPKEQFRPGRDNMEINRRKGLPGYRLAIEDPQNPDNDVSGGSREIHHIRTAFKQAFLALTTPGLDYNIFDSHADHLIVLQRPTLLNRILSIDRELLIRRDALEEAYERYLETEANAADEAPYCSEYEDEDAGRGAADRGRPKRARSPYSGDRYGGGRGSEPDLLPFKRSRY